MRPAASAGSIPTADGRACGDRPCPMGDQATWPISHGPRTRSWPWLRGRSNGRSARRLHETPFLWAKQGLFGSAASLVRFFGRGLLPASCRTPAATDVLRLGTTWFLARTPEDEAFDARML